MIASRKVQFLVEEEDKGLRLDQLLAKRIPELSRRKSRVLIDIGGVFVNGTRVKVAGRKPKVGQKIVANLGGALERAKKEVGNKARTLDAKDLPKYTVLFEDEYLVVVNKPSGLLTAPTPESDRNNLADLLARRKAKTPIWVVHRLDMATSGILVFAKTKDANRKMGELFRVHNIQRHYVAFVSGIFPSSCTEIKSPIGGKSALTQIETVETLNKNISQVNVRLETGRTHQIRIHFKERGHFVLGDKLYGVPTEMDPPRLALHARILGFVHPLTEEELRFELALPAALKAWVRRIQEKP